jgi:hypothetical protein
MPRKRNSITVATARSQRQSVSATDTAADNDRSRSVTPPLQTPPLQTPPLQQSTPPPAYIWIDHNRRPHPFIEEGNKRRLMCFEVEGTVVDYFLKSDSKFGHYITVRLSPEDILSIKNIVRGAPNHSEENFQWPIYNDIAKFKSNPDPLQPNAPFGPILDARTIDDFKNHNGHLEALPPDDVRKDMPVSIEYTPVPYQRGKDYNGGCSLDLYSITALKMEGQILHYDTSSPSKRARLH